MTNAIGPGNVAAPAFGPDPRRKPVQREHIFQRHIKLFVREAVLAEHEFFAFDRTPARGRFTHMREKARGIQKATPDTLLRVKGLRPIWCELKAQRKVPDEDQMKMGERLEELGDHWSWADSVWRYYIFLKNAVGVPMRANAELIAQDHDLRVQAGIEAAEIKAGRLPRRFKEAKPSASRIAAAHKAGVWAR